MPTITIKNEPHEVTQEVKDAMNEYFEAMHANYAAAVALQDRVGHLEHLIRDWKIRTETATLHPTKYMRMASHDAKVRLMESVGAEVVQGLLM